ncbi:MAG TPA: flagellar protein FlgN [Candidatus Accumulibacter phosphatis]|nr:MAG: FlgN protein [Candidatus Accumulibacter sp. SK-11]HCN67509.1 flagellar protein FlgN [Accumulibacter sp.]HCV12357.1 flagellar protein FlgN [Accumulibacter sp.]HRL74820.1 flagellar protein FlgN [Candidatus Accumulibacter phosphatis]HRQ95019.1 flagellar protein FlgN [Candidatus Accumulibacter phosphatis]
MTDLRQLFAEEVALVRRFVGLLEREQSLLIDGEVDSLPALLRDKNELAARLTAIAEQRSVTLAGEGLSADRAGVAAWFAAHPGEHDARAAWAELLPLATHARELNELNGEVIQLRLQNNAQAIEALLGSSGALALYGPDGQSKPSGVGRISDSA